MIFFTDQLNPDYRLGNQLFGYNLLRQLSTALGIAYAHPPLRERRWFRDMDEAKRLDRQRPATRISQMDLMEAEREDILARIAEADREHRDIELVQPLLGETFFRYTVVDPNRFFRARSSHRLWSFPKGSVTNVGVHFRGKDYLQWDKRAVLDFDYYERAIELCIAQTSPENTAIWLFTDDPRLEAYRRLVAHIRSAYRGAGLKFGSRIGPPIVDLLRMSLCDYLVCAPSTFSFWGGVLGKQKRIIQSKKWIDAKLQEDSLFWTEMMNRQSPFYQIWQLT